MLRPRKAAASAFKLASKRSDVENDDASGKTKSVPSMLPTAMTFVSIIFIGIIYLKKSPASNVALGGHTDARPVAMKLPPLKEYVGAGEKEVGVAPVISGRKETDKADSGGSSAIQKKSRSHDVRDTAKVENTDRKMIGFSPAEDEALLLDVDGTKLHLVFSTDCSSYQHWQSYVLFHSAMKVRQPGHVTRIASGCTDKEAADAKAWHEEHIATLSNRFELHLTPHFSSVKDSDGKTVGDYEFFNKPFGLRHWMEYGEGMGFDPQTGKMKDEDVVVILTDPDQLLLRPVNADFSSTRDVMYWQGKDAAQKTRVEHGRPFAQTYGFSTQWKRYVEVAGPDSPAAKVDAKTAAKHFPVGPPYLATARDMHAISVKWTEFVPKVHKLYPELLAEMYAYCIAAAHLELPHVLIESMMVSNVGSGGEAWKFIDAIPGNEVCSFAKQPDHEKYALPNVIHFCQRYGVGDKAFFGKRKLPKDFFTCESPLLEDPPEDIGSGKYLYRLPPMRTEKKVYSKEVEKREAFMVCGMTSAVNQASIFFKKHHCAGSNPNLDRSINLHDLPE